MLKTVYNTKVSRFSQIMQDDKYVANVWLPKFIRARIKTKLVKQYNEISLNDDQKKEIIDIFYNSSVYVRLILYSVLEFIFTIKESDTAKKLYEHHFKRKFDADAINILRKKIKRLEMIYEAGKEQMEPTEIDFDEYVRKIESIQDKKELHNIFLYQLPLYEQAALNYINKAPKEEK